MIHFFEDIPLGYQSEVGRWQLTPEDVVNFAKQWDPQPFHVDKAAAEESVFGGMVASSLHIFAICTRLFFDHEDQIQTMAMLGKDKVRFSQPARANDLLIYNTTCTKHPLGSSTRLDFRACKVYTQLIGVDIRSNTSMWDFRRTVGGLLATAKNLRRSNR